ncbi:hypothetical protein [Curtobacterium flaccumfaciens]|uniref:hypothetical protein n=1 Tax=Curtobacterium flaccumfaciens TaxID=2035 RepID=UPI0038792B42
MKVSSLTHELDAIEAQHEVERRAEAERKRLDTRTVATLVSNDDYAFIEREAERRGLRTISALIQTVAVEDPQLLPARTQLELASKKFTSSEGGRPPADPSKRRGKNLKAKCSTAMRASLEDEAALFDLKVSDYLTNLLRGQDPRTRGGHIAAAKAEKSAREMRKKEEEAGVTNGDEAAAFWKQSVRDIRRAHGLIE